MIKVGICFSKEFKGNAPLGHLKTKTPVYVQLLDLCLKQGWKTYVLTKKTYKEKGIFAGAWEYINGGKFKKVNKNIKLDLVYDRTGGTKFPPKGEKGCVFVNNIEFKILAWDKWLTYQKLKRYMPKTLWVGKVFDLGKFTQKMGTNYIVLKPFNGLQGKGIFIGLKKDVGSFDFLQNKKYIIQEFVDTSGGIKGITKGSHDLRIVVINNKPVWCHVREPIGKSLLANAAQGGNLTEVDYKKVPQSIKNIVTEISKDFYKEFDNPIYSLDFGMDKDGTPQIFEINDQMGFPRKEMKNTQMFLENMIDNFKSKL